MDKERTTGGQGYCCDTGCSVAGWTSGIKTHSNNLRIVFFRADAGKLTGKLDPGSSEKWPLSQSDIIITVLECVTSL